MKKRFVFFLCFLLLLTGCALEESPSKTSTISSSENSQKSKQKELIANADHFNKIILKTFDDKIQIEMVKGLLQIATLKKEYEVMTEEHFLTFEELYDIQQYKAEITTDGDTYYLRNEEELDLSFRMLSATVYEDQEGVRYQVQTFSN